MKTLLGCRSFPHLVWALLLGAGLTLPAQPAQAGSLTVASHTHHWAYHQSGSTVTLAANLSGYFSNTATVNYFRFHINGQIYDATVDPVQSGFQGIYVLDITGQPLPKQFNCYVTASVTVNYYQSNTYLLDSRDARSDPDGTTGDGHITEIIVSNIKLKALKWEDNGIPVTVDDNYYATFDPTTETYTRVLRPNAQNPYHWWLTQTSTGDELLGPYPAVYLKGAAPKITVEVQPLTGTVPVRARLNMDLSPTTPGYPFNTLSGALGNNKVTITCPALNNEVNIISISTTWNFECQFADGTWSGIYGRNNDAVDGMKLYAVYSTPLTPQSPPWIGVLEDSCRWAAGKNTALDVARYETTGLFFAQHFLYPSNTGSWWTDDVTGEFELPEFFDPAVIASRGWDGFRYGNCVDVSDYLSICARSVGLGFMIAKYHNNPVGSGQFNSIPVCLIGSDPAVDGNYAVSTWGWHQIATYSTVYDSCAAHKLDLSGASFRNPPFNWPLNGFWQTDPVNDLGLVDAPIGASNPSSPTLFFGPVAPEIIF